MSTETALVVGGLMNDGCIAVLDEDGVPTNFVAPSTYAGPSDGKRYDLRYGPTPTSCLLVSRSAAPGPAQVERVSRFDVVSGELVDVPVSLPDLDGHVHSVDLVSPDGRVVDVMFERSGRSYGREFVARVSDGRVISRTYLPVRATFTRDHQFLVKHRKDGVKRALRVDRTTGETVELLLTPSTKVRLDVRSLAPDHSLILIEEIEWLTSQESSRQTRQYVFDTVTGELVGRSALSGGEAFTAWLSTSHLAVTIHGRDFVPTTRILRLPELVQVGEHVGWPSTLCGGLRGDRIWGLDVLPPRSARAVISAPIGGGPTTTHHRFGEREQLGVFLDNLLTFEIDMPDSAR